MRIGILGTGVVGKTLGSKLAKLGNDVLLALWVRLYMKLQTPNVNVHVAL